MPIARIIFVNRVYRPSESATAQLLTDMAEGLAQQDWDVHVIASGSLEGSYNGVMTYGVGNWEQHGGLLSRTANYLGFLFSARRMLSTLVRPGDVVVLKTDPPLLAPFVAFLVKRRGASLVHWVQDVYPEIAIRHIGIWISPLLAPWRWLRDRAWRGADHSMAVSADMAGRMYCAGVDSNRLSICPNWAPRELDKPVSSAQIETFRKEHGLEGKYLVAYSGNLGRVHEFDTLAGAAKRLSGESHIQFLIMGGGARLSEVKSKVEKAGLRNVLFLPAQPRDRFAVTLSAADAHLVTLRSGFDGLVYPSKLAGILAIGRPAIFVGPTTCEIFPMLSSESCGAAVPTGNDALLAETILLWSREPGKNTALGRAARACYLNRFSFPSALHLWNRVLRSLVDKRTESSVATSLSAS